MKGLKKAGVYTGIAVGGAVGGTVSFVGKMIHKPGIDALGESVMDSAILSGEIAGEALNGTVNIVAGAIRKDKASVHAGRRELKRAGSRMVDNVVENAKLVAHQAGDIACGVCEGDRDKVVGGLKTLGKMVAIELLTVGAIQMDGKKQKASARQVVRIVPAAPATARVFPAEEEILAHRRCGFYTAEQKMPADREKRGFFRRLWGR